MKSCLMYDFRNEWESYLTMLSPFFKTMDIMRYTYLAILTKDQLLNMLESEKEDVTKLLPTSAVIGCVRYHFPTFLFESKVQLLPIPP